MAQHAGQTVVDGRTGGALGGGREAGQRPQHHAYREDHRTGPHQKCLHTVPQAGDDVFEIGHAEGGQLHQQRELLHVALAACHPFEHPGGDRRRQDAGQIQRKQREPLQVEHAPHRLVGDDGRDDQCIDGQTGRAGEHRRNGNGDQPLARILDGAGGHDGRHGAGKAGEQRDEGPSREAGARQQVVEQKGRSRQVARVFEQQDEGKENGDLRQEHQHTAGTGNHAVDQQVRQQPLWQRGPHPFAQRIEEPLDAVHDRLRPGVDGLKDQQQDGEQDQHAPERMHDDVVERTVPGRQLQFGLHHLRKDVLDLFVQGIAVERLQFAFGLDRVQFGCMTAGQRQRRGFDGHDAAFADGHGFEHGSAQQFAEFFRVDLQATGAGHVAEVERDDHRQAEGFQLQHHAQRHAQVGGVGHGDDAVRTDPVLAQQHVTSHCLVGAGGAQAVGARQVDEAHLTVADETAFAPVHGDAGIVGHLGMGAGQAIEEDGLATVGRPQQCKGGGLAAAGLSSRVQMDGLRQAGGGYFGHDQRTSPAWVEEERVWPCPCGTTRQRILAASGSRRANCDWLPRRTAKGPRPSSPVATTISGTPSENPRSARRRPTMGSRSPKTGLGTMLSMCTCAPL